MFDFGELILMAGIVARLTRLITIDRLPFAPVRAWVKRRFGRDSLLDDGLQCDFCMSVWVAIATLAAALLAGHTLWFQGFGVVCLLSWITGFVNQRT